MAAWQHGWRLPVGQSIQSLIMAAWFDSPAARGDDDCVKEAPHSRDPPPHFILARAARVAGFQASGKDSSGGSALCLAAWNRERGLHRPCGCGWPDRRERKTFHSSVCRQLSNVGQRKMGKGTKRAAQLVASLPRVVKHPTHRPIHVKVGHRHFTRLPATKDDGA